MAQNFQNIQVWRDAVEFHKTIIKIIPTFPKEEIYAMSSQLRRASLSISNNIAEGCGRESKKELKNFLNIAMGSIKEVESMIMVAQKLDYISTEQFTSLMQKIIIIGKKINALMQVISKDLSEKQNNKNSQFGRSPKNQEPKTKNQEHQRS